ncbi:hypothetical protein SAMN06297387_13111 [Streptomyces zhaozhouensis]|uniref:Uncharacterized protein n=1 Tax=Streptomyces zhaozhouensis TaxID=1300267 RepID=A0A286E962_9ACTN|nr:hypothetical protein [Streptomyces zhaozhouensis]SOD67419.1 hypothetical protein SAMN06297387_13111 [Streptomyces zhaozhouensis]
MGDQPRLPASGPVTPPAAKSTAHATIARALNRRREPALADEHREDAERYRCLAQSGRSYAAALRGETKD